MFSLVIENTMLRKAMYSAILQYRNSVRPSVRLRYCVKTAKHIVDILSPLSRPIITPIYVLTKF